jgi:hypothetical protein
MRARFHVDSVTKHSIGSTSVLLVPVAKGSDEKTKFWQATPSGSLEMSITNPNAQDFFRVGADYYIDFALVEPSGDSVIGGGIGTIIVVIATAMIWTQMRKLRALHEYE